MWFREGDWIGTFDSFLARVAECSICTGDRDREEYKDAAAMDLEVLELIAQGGYGQVFRCRDPQTGTIVAMKQIMVFVSQGIPPAVIREVSILKELHHKNIVSLLKVKVSDNRRVNMIFEHLECDLHYFIQNRGFSKDAFTVKSFMYQILLAVEYCHARKILHRDLKPKNVLVNKSGTLIKLADFGLAREFGADIVYCDKLGTSWYRAPEIFCNSKQYSSPVDLWSVGCIFAEMMMGQPLFYAIKCQDELEAIFRLLGTPTEETWPGITELMPNIRHYPQFDPLGLKTFVPHLDSNGMNLLSRMLCMNPTARISASAALNHEYFKDVNWILGGAILE